MKKLILFAFTAMFLMSCGGAGQQPTDYITFGQAFNHVSQSFTYWLFVVLTTAGTGLFFYKAIQANKSGADGRGLALLAFVFIVLTAFAWLYRPCEVAANTTVEQAARGVFIGY